MSLKKESYDLYKAITDMLNSYNVKCVDSVTWKEEGIIQIRDLTVRIRKERGVPKGISRNGILTCYDVFDSEKPSTMHVFAEEKPKCVLDCREDVLIYVLDKVLAKEKMDLARFHCGKSALKRGPVKIPDDFLPL